VFRKLLPLFLLAFAACAPLPPSPADIQAKHFDPVPGKAVIYVVRNRPDLTDDAATLMLDGQMMGTTYPGTYFRWVVAPGRHEIRGYAGDNGRFVLDVPPDGVYFVQQSVTWLIGPAQSSFRPIDPNYGRTAVMRASLVGGA